MSLEHLRLDAIVEANLQQLVTDREEERKTIDYKVALPGRSDGAKKEFLADVVSFANTAGGDLVYGVREDGSVAVEVCGVPALNADTEIRALEESIRKGIAPRIPSIASRAVALASGSQVRAAFAASESLTGRVRQFRKDRLSVIRAHGTPVAMREGALLVLHLIPFSALRPGTLIDLSRRDLGQNFVPIASGGYERFNFDGFLGYTDETEATGYVQLFRSGCIEAVDFNVLASGATKTIPSSSFEMMLIQAVVRYGLKLRSLDCQPPIVVMLSLLGVHGYRMGVAPRFEMFHRGAAIERDELLVPELVSESFDFSSDNVAALLRPAFDAVWNACGYSGSINYDEAGRWSVT